MDQVPRLHLHWGKTDASILLFPDKRREQASRRRDLKIERRYETTYCRNCCPHMEFPLHSTPRLSIVVRCGEKRKRERAFFPPTAEFITSTSPQFSLQNHAIPIIKTCTSLHGFGLQLCIVAWPTHGRLLGRQGSSHHTDQKPQALAALRIRKCKYLLDTYLGRYSERTMRSVMMPGPIPKLSFVSGDSVVLLSLIFLSVLCSPKRSH